MIFKRVLGRALGRVELVHRYRVLIRACKEVPAVGEADLSAQLDADLLKLLQAPLEHIHHAHLVSETDHDVET